MRTALLAAGAALAAFLTTRTSQAAPPWVDRPLTLPSGDWAFDAGLGVGHVGADGSGPRPQAADETDVGTNLELAVGFLHRFELGVRTGLRFGDAPSRAVNADDYGRLFDRQTLPPGAEGAEVLANPEVRFRAALLRGDVVELGLEGRLVLPFANPSVAGMMFGVPMAFHLGDIVRLDTGAYLPVVFYHDETRFNLSLPVDVWIQATRRLWLGPMTGLAFNNVGSNPGSTWVSLGFGLGYQLTHALDLKTMLLFPDINDDSRDFGAGVGLQVRVE